MATEATGKSVNDYVQDLVLDTRDVEEFLTELTILAVRTLSEPGEELLCGITLLRERRAATVASSSERAQYTDEIQYSYGDGPCLRASREQRTVHIADLATDGRWPDYAAAVMKHGIRSSLAVPFDLEGDATKAAMNLYSDHPNRFNDQSIALTEAFARQMSRALRLAVRIAQHSDTTEHLKAAMESRTTINLATGIIMGQNRCSQEEATRILKAASSSRNVKMRVLAENIVSSSGGGPATTHFEG